MKVILLKGCRECPHYMYEVIVGEGMNRFCSLKGFDIEVVEGEADYLSRNFPEKCPLDNHKR